MSYRYLSREEMVSVTASLVDETHDDCRAIRAYHLGRALWELVATAHALLLATQRLGPTPERMLEISELLSALDIRHDDLVRGLYYALLAQEYLAADPAIREAARKLRNKMFPDGIMATRKSYRGQVGQAEMLRSRLSSEDMAALRKLSTADGNSLATALDELFQVAGAMGELENERGGDGDDTPTAADVLAARSQWIRAIHAFMAPLRLRDDVPDKIVAILDRIEGVAVAAGRRHQARRQQDAPAQPDTDPAGELPDGDTLADHADTAINSNDVMNTAGAANQADADIATMDQPAGEEPAA